MLWSMEENSFSRGGNVGGEEDGDFGVSSICLLDVGAQNAIRYNYTVFMPIQRTLRRRKDGGTKSFDSSSSSSPTTWNSSIITTLESRLRCW